MRDLLAMSTRAALDGGVVLHGLLAAGLTMTVAVGSGLLLVAVTAPIERALVAICLGPLLVGVAIPPLVGVYSRTWAGANPAGEGPDADGPTTSDGGGVRGVGALTVRTLRTCGPTLVTSIVVWAAATLLLGLALGLAFVAIGLAALTAVQFGAYGLGMGRLLGPFEVIWLAAGLLGAGFSAGILTTRFFDCFVCATDAGPVSSIRESLRFVRTDPRSFFGYAVLVWLLGAAASGVASLFSMGLSDVAGFVTFLVVLGLYFAFFATFHATVFEQRVVPAVVAPGESAGRGSSDRTGTPVDPRIAQPSDYSVSSDALVARPARFALVVLVLTGLLLGAGTVRALDVRPTADFDAPGPVDGEQPPEEIFTTESVPQSETSYHAEQRSTCWNESTESWESPVIFDLAHDPPDRRMLLEFSGPDANGELVHQQTSYFSPRMFAAKYGEANAKTDTSRRPRDQPWYQRTAGDWIVYSGIGYYLVEDDDGWLPREFIKQDWTVAEETDDAVVLTASDLEGAPPLGDGDPIDDATEVEVHVDRETGLLARVYREGYSSVEEPGDECARKRLTMTFDGWGTTEVERPAQIAGVTPLEWLWAIAYY